jgi:hypothetical protein
LPIAGRRSPTFSLPESAKRAGSRSSPSTRTTARSLAVKAPRSVARWRLPSGVVIVNVRDADTTWALVTMSPSESKTIPEPSFPSLSTCTTEASATWTACSEPAEGSPGPMPGDVAARPDPSSDPATIAAAIGRCDRVLRSRSPLALSARARDAARPGQ